MVKNVPANARDRFDLGGSHTPWGNYAHVPQLLNLCSRTQEPQLLKHVYSGACVPREEKSVQWEACALQLDSSPHSPQLEKSPHSNPAGPKINEEILFLNRKYQCSKTLSADRLKLRKRVGHDWATSLSLFTFMHWKEMASHSSVLAWRIPGTGEPGGLPSMG